MAERGQLAEAVAALEEAPQHEVLPWTDFALRADWCLALGRRDDYRRSLDEMFAVMGPSQAQQWLYRMSDDKARGGALSDDDAAALAKALIRSDQGRQGLGDVLRRYALSRDPRIWDFVADGVLGQAADAVARYVNEVEAAFSGGSGDEAAADAVYRRCAELRQTALSQADRRRLDMLELAVASQSAALKDQPGPHVAAALDALRRLSAAPLSAAERRSLVNLLARFRDKQPDTLRDAQIRGLEQLVDRAPRASVERLETADILVRLLESCLRLDAAIDRARSALDDFRRNRGGEFSATAEDLRRSLVRLLEHRGRYREAEEAVAAELRRQGDPTRRERLRLELYEVYREALDAGGTVSLGAGKQLYRELAQRVGDLLDEPGEERRAEWIAVLCGGYEAARRQDLTDRREFFRLTWLPRSGAAYWESIASVANTLATTAGNEAALAFLLDRIETRPDWAWSLDRRCQEIADQLDRLHKETRLTPELEARLVPALVARLQLALRGGGGRWTGDVGYAFAHGDAWKGQENKFAAAARRMADHFSGRPQTVLRIAEYLKSGLRRPAEAVAALRLAFDRGQLDDTGMATLVQWYDEADRNAEAIPILERLVRGNASDVDNPVRLLVGYHAAGRESDARAVLRAADAKLHGGEMPDAQAAAKLAEGCLRAAMWPEAIQYYRMAILSLRLAPASPNDSRSAGDQERGLSAWHRGLAKAYGHVGHYAEAVDAACAALVTAGPKKEEQSAARQTLDALLAAAPDLDAFADRLNRQAAVDGFDAPLLRAGLGRAYQRRKQTPQAIAQFRRASALQPDDSALCQELVAALDQAGDQAAATAELIGWAQQHRPDLALWSRLVERLESQRRPDEAQRVATSLIDILPGRPEGFVLLARQRQREKHGEEALQLWQRAAELAPRDLDVLLSLAEALAQQLRWEEADQVLCTIETKRLARQTPPDLKQRLDGLRARVPKHGRGNGSAKVPVPH